MGDGIQAIILLTYPLYMFPVNEQVLFFIEEPEIYLHPGMQRRLLDLYTDQRFANYIFFLTTHSNHFLDISTSNNEQSRVSIFTFQKKESIFTIKNLRSPDKDILNLLGVKSSSVLLSNCVIWVEGITDRLFISHCLKFLTVKSFDG